VVFLPNELDFFDPWKKMTKRMTRMFDEFFPVKFPGSWVRQPLLDVIDEGKKFKVLAELPGVEKDKINVEVEEDSLTLSAETKTEAKKEDKKKGYYFQERSYQSFYRKIPLPEEVVPEKATATYKNGVLEVSLPKKHPVKTSKKSKKIKVK
jgi:HSP20 family protein